MTTLVYFEGGPADGQYRDVPADPPRIEGYAYGTAVQNVTKVTYRDSGRFTLHGPVARIFVYEQTD